MPLLWEGETAYHLEMGEGLTGDPAMTPAGLSGMNFFLFHESYIACIIHKHPIKHEILTTCRKTCNFISAGLPYILSIFKYLPLMQCGKLSTTCSMCQSMNTLSKS